MPSVGCSMFGAWMSDVPGPPLRSQRFKVHPTAKQRPAAVDYLSRFLCAGFALALLVTGCVGPRPLKGGKAVTTRKPTGIVEQTLVQGENPAQTTKQDQETIKVRTYTVPAGSRIEQSQPPPAAPLQLSTINSQPINFPLLPQPSALNYRLSTINCLHRERSHARR